MGQENCHPKPGDLIEIDRPYHQHWALYLGDGYVINLTPVGKKGAVGLEVHTLPEYIRKVQKQHLKKVVGKNKWHINNESDQSCSPLPVEEIIQRAEHSVDLEVTYHLFGSNCERFVKRLRYGDQERNFVCGKMNIPEMAQERHNPKPGDLIEIKQPDTNHWALGPTGEGICHPCYIYGSAPPVSASTETILIIQAKVKKEFLKKVVGNHEWCVNNKYDWFRTPLPVELIIQHAEGYIGREVEYCLFPNGREHFVEKLRYGDQMAQNMTYPDPGDLIEIRRTGYQHWALYMGKGYVIHVTAVDENAPALSASTVTIFTKKAKVKKQLLTKVVGNNKWYVNNKYDLRRCPYPVEEILQRAEQWIAKVVPYRLFRSNCEHFVTMLRYGGAFPDQVLKALTRSTGISTAAGLGLVNLISLATNPFLFAAAGVGFFANIGLMSHTSRHILKCLDFQRSQYDTIDQMCC